MTTVCVHLHTLCLGTDTGQVRIKDLCWIRIMIRIYLQVRIYQLSDPVDLLRLDLGQPSHTVEVGGGRVSDVAMSVHQDRHDTRDPRGHLVMAVVGGGGAVTCTTWTSAFTHHLDNKGASPEQR